MLAAIFRVSSGSTQSSSTGSGGGEDSLNIGKKHDVLSENLQTTYQLAKPNFSSREEALTV